MTAWLEAFNSGDRTREEAFINAYSWGADLENVLRWRAEVGGYDLLDIYTNDQAHILFRLKARANGGEEIGTIQVSAAAPRALTELATFRIPPGARFEEVTFDGATRARVIDRVTRVLNDSYVFPQTARKMSAVLRKRKTSRAYRSIRDGREFARQLTADLQEVSRDKHLDVRFSYVVLPADLTKSNPGEESKQLAAVNCGFEKAEHLWPNVGYLKLDVFADTEICARTASAAMNFVADSDALILDLRDNHGGGGGMVEFIASYLFAERTHLDDTYSRTQNATEETWTSPDVPGKKFLGKPVFVLTSKQTFSAAEYLANVLRNLRRATLIGETTGGGSHMVEIMRIDAHFSVRVPTARPITRTDWEGTGVAPDVQVAADRALDAALKLAADEIDKNR
ncbi:MAG TPA: S41 family peptidase [Steroidobacteraceae bacterium]|nr:S41 family peptidase [Steroidobacteraceae bacterium]